MDVFERHEEILYTSMSDARLMGEGREESFFGYDIYIYILTNASYHYYYL